MKTLYFEGLGCVPCGDVENCRIATAFHNDKGQPIHLELAGWGEKNSLGSVCTCIITYPQKQIKYNKAPFEYSKAGILKFVNSLPGCAFDEIVVLPKLAGYQLFKSNKNIYNFSEDFHYDKELTKRREAIEKHYYDLEKSEGKQYPNFSAWVDEEIFYAELCIKDFMLSP